jgi:TadE-like protein
MSRARRGPDDRGVAALETALILSFVLVPLVFASFDFGRAFWAKTQLTNAAREGGSFAQFYPKLVGPAAASGCDGQDTVFLHASRELSDSSGNITVPNSTVGSTLKIRVPGAAGTPAYTVKVFQRTGTAPSFTWTPITGCDIAGTPLPVGTIVRVEVSADIAIVTPVVSQIVGSSIHVTGRQDVRVQ